MDKKRELPLAFLMIEIKGLSKFMRVHADWQEHLKSHEALIAPWADAFLERRGLHKTHAVQDFLFTYYPFSPAKLRQWVPSFEEALPMQLAEKEQFQELYPWLNDYWFSFEKDLLVLNPERIHEGTRKLAGFVAELCENILNRPPRFGCFGLHEWAMVYKASEETIRHQGHRLRLKPTDLAEFVDSQNICCSHYDAYRFFTPEARGLNILNPSYETRLAQEQGGCLHANMDLYKWATKLWPWVGSDLIRKTFLLAVEGRELDMRASPYDLADLGYTPIFIEREEGRQHYQQEQQRLTERATPIRQELQAICNRLLLI